MLKLNGTYSDIAHSVYISNTTGVLLEAGTTYPSRAPEFTVGLWWCPVWSSFSLFVLSYYEYLRFEFRVVRNDIFIINDMRFLFTSSCLQEDSCISYVICVCLHIVFLLCFSPFYVQYVANLSELSIFDCPFIIL